VRLTHSLRRQVAWLALCAVAFAAVAPSVSRWAVSSAGWTWVSICGASGVKRIALETGPAAPAPSDKHGGGTHCPFCRLQDHLPVLPPVDLALFLPAAAQSDEPSAFDIQPVRARPLRAPALSRAPPASS